MKQSQKTFLPLIHDSVLFNDFVRRNNTEQKFICTSDAPLSQHLKNICKPNQIYSVLIGPEGDFSPEEIKLALENNFVEASLGTTRLRTETAGIVACCIVNFVNG